MRSRGLLHATSAVLAAGMLLLALTASSGKPHGNPHTGTTTTTVAPTTSNTTTTTTTTGDLVDAFAAQLGFPTRNPTLSDDFTGIAGTKPDTTRWAAKTYTDSASSTYWNGLANCQLDGNGHLDIAAVHDPNSPSRWDSTFLTGLHAYSGPRFVDVRAKVPAGNGPWAAPAWEWAALYGTPPGPELDTVEQLGREPSTYHATLHYWDATGDHQLSYAVNTGVNLADAFHDYQMAVYADRVVFLFDGTVVRTVTRLNWPSTWTFDTAAVVLNIDLAMGGSWAGPIDPTLSSPVHELVDYERVYQP